jgi:4,5-DOPA dioxygenase extradiol
VDTGRRADAGAVPEPRGTPGTPLVYDFAGFDRRYLEMTYPTPDAGALAARVAAAMPDSEPVHLTHGLPYLTRDMVVGSKVPAWSADFDQWAADALARGDVDTLAGFRGKAPGVAYAHPTVEHYTPLFVTLGAATDPERPVQTTIEGYFIGLSKRSFQAA